MPMSYERYSHKKKKTFSLIPSMCLQQHNIFFRDHDDLKEFKSSQTKPHLTLMMHEGSKNHKRPIT